MTKNRFALTIPAASLLVLGGCAARPAAGPGPAGGPGTVAAVPGERETGPGRTPTSFDRTYHAVDFGRRSETEAAAAPDATGARGRHGVLTGLYGELAAGPATTRRTDAESNLAQITATIDGACFQPDVDPSGRLIAFASTQHREKSDIFIKAVDGRTQRQVTSDPANDEMPTFSPDGRRIAFCSDRYGNWDVFVTSIDGGLPLRVSEDLDHEIHPTFSPDGRHLAYCRLASHNGQWEVWTVDLESGQHRFLAYGLFPEWNPDPARNRIVFQRARERGSRLFSIWTLDIIDGEATNKTEIVSAANAAVVHPTWSPDGRQIAFCTIVDPDEHGESRPPQSDVWIVNADGTGRTNLTNGQSMNLFPDWSVDGTVFFLSDRSGNDNVWAIETGRTARLRPAADDALTTVDPLLERND